MLVSLEESIRVLVKQCPHCPIKVAYGASAQSYGHVKVCSNRHGPLVTVINMAMAPVAAPTCVGLGHLSIKLPLVQRPAYSPGTEKQLMSVFAHGVPASRVRNT